MVWPTCPAPVLADPTALCPAELLPSASETQPSTACHRAFARACTLCPEHPSQQVIVQVLAHGRDFIMWFVISSMPLPEDEDQGRVCGWGGTQRPAERLARHSTR